MPAYYYGTGIAKERFQYFLSNPPQALAIDVETISLKERMPLGFAIAFSPEEAFYFQVHPEPPRELELLKPLLFNPQVCKIAHNILFDMGVLPMIPQLAGFDRSNIFDTNTAARLLGKELTALSILAPEVGMITEDAKTTMSRFKASTMLDVPAMEVAEKCQQDAKATFALYLDYQPKIASQYAEYFKVEMAVIPILIDLSLRGLAIDQRARAELEAQLEDEVEFYRRQLEEYGVEKPGSAQQVGYMLGKRGNFLPMTRSKKQLSTTEANLEFLDDPMAAAVLGWRHKSKLLSTYISPIAGDDRFYCLHPDTRVLKADLSWQRIADVKPNDEVIGLDMQGKSGRSWKMTREKVGHLDFISAPSYRITTQYGSVIANAEHPWLVVSGGAYKGKAMWVRTDELNTSHKIKYICSPWEEDSESWDAGYLAGIADGEGYASNAHVGIVQKPGDTWQWILFMLERCGFGGYITEQNKNHKTMCARFNMTESMRFLGIIRPRRLLENAHKVWEGRQPRGFEPAQVESVEYIGESELVNMVTGNHTFIAEGMVTHNTEYYLDTVVGRLNSRNRNIQNIPPECRHIFLPDNGCFTTGDYCLAPNTLVLKSDLSWERIDCLSDGDELVGIEEYPLGGKGSRRKLLKTKIQNLGLVERETYRITMTDGRVIEASGEHPWLVLDDIRRSPLYQHPEWRMTKDMKPGTMVRQLCSSTWEHDTSYDAALIAGFFAGEGWIDKSYHMVGFGQNEGPTLDLLIGKLRNVGFEFTLSKGSSSSTVQYRLTHMSEMIRFIGAVRPPRLIENSDYLWIGYEPPKLDAWAEVWDIESIGTKELVSIETDSHTFVAEGLLTHNSQEHLYILMHFSQDRDMKRVYEEGYMDGDIHRFTAQQMFGTATPDRRRLAKTVNYAIVYGATARTISEAAKIKDKDFCGKLLDRWFKAFPGATDWIQTAQRAGIKSGWAEPTLFGRMIHIPEEFDRWGHVNTDGMKRKAVNYPILGSDGEIMKRAIILCNSRGLGPPVMAASVHDSLTFDGDVVLPVEELEMIPSFRIPFEVKTTFTWD